MRAPNILLITSDQHRGDCFGFAGRGVKTPHLDLMAAEGSRFATAITPNPVCQPARASILTGKLPLTHGVRDNGIDLPPETAEQGFAGQLSRAGWQTGFIGKAHFSSHHTFTPTGTPECRQSMDQYGPDWCGPYMGFQHVELVVEGHNHWLPMAPPFGQHYERWYYGDGRGESKNQRYKTPLPPDSGGALQTFNSALPVAWHNSTWVGDRTIDFLRQHKDDDAPFCLWASFPDPHHPFDAPEPWCHLHRPEDVDLPPHRERDFERRPWWHRAVIEGVPGHGNAEINKMRNGPVQSEAQLRKVIANYYGMISLIDHQIGRIDSALHELGLAENTIVIFTADHGEWLGDHGLLLKGPMLYDGLLRVGMIAKGPGIPAGNLVTQPVSTLDLAPTFFDYAGLASDGLHGQSLRTLFEGGKEIRDYAYNEWDVGAERCGVPLLLRTVRDERYRLTLELESGAGELYDFATDPFECVNLFEHKDYAEVRDRLTGYIHARPDDALPEPLPVSGLA